MAVQHLIVTHVAVGIRAGRRKDQILLPSLVWSSCRFL